MDPIEFQNVDIDVINFIAEVLDILEEKEFGFESQRMIKYAKADLELYPYVPGNDFFVSFEKENRSFNIAYTFGKIEISDYISEDSGFGIDHYQSFIRKYEVEGYSENEGSESVMYEMLDLIRELEAEEINISDED